MGTHITIFMGDGGQSAEISSRRQHRLVVLRAGMATTRGRLLELMTLTLRPGDTEGANTAFTVGMMSLMDALFSVPMHEILDRVEVSQEVRAAQTGDAAVRDARQDLGP